MRGQPNRPPGYTAYREISSTIRHPYRDKGIPINTTICRQRKTVRQTHVCTRSGSEREYLLKQDAVFLTATRPKRMPRRQEVSTAQFSSCHLGREVHCQHCESDTKADRNRSQVTKLQEKEALVRRSVVQVTGRSAD